MLVGPRLVPTGVVRVAVASVLACMARGGAGMLRCSVASRACLRTGLLPAASAVPRGAWGRSVQRWRMCGRLRILRPGAEVVVLLRRCHGIESLLQATPVRVHIVRNSKQTY